MKNETPATHRQGFGKMVRGVSPFLLEEDQVSDSQNMTPGFFWEQRKGMSTLTATAVTNTPEFRSIYQYRRVDGVDDILVVHLYDSTTSPNDRIAYGSALPPNAITWTKLIDCGTSPEITQFATVNNTLIWSNDVDFGMYRGTEYLPSGVWRYDVSENKKYNHWDDLVDDDSSTTLDISSAPSGDGIIVVAPMVVDDVEVTMSTTNGNRSLLVAEYWAGTWTELLPASWWSNTTYDDDDCSSLTPWDDDDTGDGATTQVTNAGFETFKFDSGTAGGANSATISQDYGAFGTGTVTMSARMYQETRGTRANNDDFLFRFDGSATRAQIRFASDGVYVYDGADWKNVGSALPEDTWVVVTLVVDLSAETVACYVDGATHFTGADCSDASPAADGDFIISNPGGTTNNMITHLEHIKVGNAIDTSGNGFTDGTSGSAGVLDDSFTGTSFRSIWTETDANNILSCNNGVIYTANGDGHSGQISTENGLYLTGDFDVMVQFSAISWSQPSAADNQLVMEAMINDNNRFLVMREWTTGNNNQYSANTRDEGSWSGEQNASTTDTSGYMRIVRSSTTVSMYYGAPGSWTQIGSDFTGQQTGDVYIVLKFSSGDASEWTAGQYDAITLNSGTVAENATLAQTGSLTWTSPSSGTEFVREINGVFGYAYRFRWMNALDSTCSVDEIRVTSDPVQKVKDIPFGQWVWNTGCLYYVSDTTASYEDYLGYVNNDVPTLVADLSGYDQSDNAALYVKFPVQINYMYINIPPEKLNDNASSMTVKYRKNDGTWAAVSNLSDGTAVGGDSLKKSGTVSWKPTSDEVDFTFGEDTFAGYWYQITWSADLSATNVEIYSIRGIMSPDDPKACRGVASWKTRAWQVGPIDNKNSLRYSAAELPSVWNGFDSGFITLGDRPLVRAVPFYNEMVVFADTEIWMVQGNSPSQFAKMRLSNKIGTCAAMSVVPIDVGVLAGGGDNVKVVLAWLFYDGFYMFDGIKWFKISAPDIDDFFDPDNALYLNTAVIGDTYGTFDFETQCCMWAVCTGSNTKPDKIIVMHFPTMRYGVYDYEVMPQSIESVYNARYYTVAGGQDGNGKFYLLQSGSTDVNSSNATVAVDAYITSRPIWSEDGHGTKPKDVTFLVEAEATGMLELEVYPDASETPQLATRQKMQNLGKLVKEIVWKPREWGKNLGTRFRLRNRSKGVRFKPLHLAVGVERTRTEE